MVDYSKFNGIGDSDDEEEYKNTSSSPTITPNLIPQAVAAVSTLEKQITQKTKRGKDGRIQFEFEGKLIYEWEQNLTETIIYIQPPPGVNKKQLNISITYHHLAIGVKGLPPYIDENTGGTVKVDESMWMLTDGELVINLQKMNKGETWECALQGNTATNDGTGVGKGNQSNDKLDTYTKEEIKKQLLLERFQEEVRKIRIL